MVSQCIVTQNLFFLLEMAEHTELDTEHSDTMEFKNNIVRTTDEIYLLVVVPNGV